MASLLGTRNVRVIIAGGLVRQDELTCIGASAVEAVRRYNTDTAVIGAAGLSARRGITELDDRDADVIRGGLERTERIIVIADGSKFGAVAMSTVVPIEQVSTIVTDISADAEEIERIEQAGIEVVVAGPETSLLRPTENGRDAPHRRPQAGVTLLRRLFGVDKPIIAMLHLPGDAGPPPPRPRGRDAPPRRHRGARSRIAAGRRRRRFPLLQRGRPAVSDARRARGCSRRWRRSSVRCAT